MSLSGPTLALRNPLPQQQHLRCAMRICQHWLRHSPSKTHRVLDVGCGAGEAAAILRQVNEAMGLACLEIHGVDPDQAALQRAVHRHDFWDRREAEPRSQWHAVNWSSAAIQPEDFDVAICLGSRHAFGEDARAAQCMVRELGDSLNPHGLLWLADGTWRQTPAAEYLKATGLEVDEMRSGDEWQHLFAQLGWQVTHEEDTSSDDFRSYEQVFWNHAEQTLRDQPNNADAQARAEHWRNWAAAFDRWGQATMGFRSWILRKN